MNDNEHVGDYAVPEWAEEIIEKHDLGLRADNPLAAATVLLTDAGMLVRKIAATAFREQALSPSTKELLDEALDMLEDVERLSTICEEEPSFGIVKVEAAFESGPRHSCVDAPLMATSKTKGVGHEVRDADGDYKPTAKSKRPRPPQRPRRAQMLCATPR